MATGPGWWWQQLQSCPSPAINPGDRDTPNTGTHNSSKYLPFLALLLLLFNVTKFTENVWNVDFFATVFLSRTPLGFSFFLSLSLLSLFFWPQQLTYELSSFALLFGHTDRQTDRQLRPHTDRPTGGTSRPSCLNLLLLDLEVKKACEIHCCFSSLSLPFFWLWRSVWPWKV